MQTSRKAPSLATIKRLFALSANKCAFPGCATELVDQQTHSIVGEVCHIKGAKPGAPRYDAHQDDSARHGFNNLILLCNIHHKVVDDNATDFPAERLLKMKEEHGRQQPDQPVESAASDAFVAHALHTLDGSNIVLQESPVVGSQIAHTITNYSFGGAWPVVFAAIAAMAIVAWHNMHAATNATVTFAQVEISTVRCNWDPLSRPIQVVAPFLNPVGRYWSFGGKPIGLPPQDQWPMGSHQLYPGIGDGGSGDRVDDPVFDVTLLNSGTAAVVVSRIGIRPIAAWTSPKGPPRSGRIADADGYAIEMQVFEMGKDQFLILAEPISLLPNDPYRFSVQLKGYCDMAPRNETVIQLIVEANQEIFVSESIYLGMYSVGSEIHTSEER
jgi:hypothetical protein